MYDSHNCYISLENVFFFLIDDLTIQKRTILIHQCLLKHMYGQTAPSGVKVWRAKDGHRGAEMTKVKEDIVQLFFFFKIWTLMRTPRGPQQKTWYLHKWKVRLHKQYSHCLINLFSWKINYSVKFILYIDNSQRGWWSSVFCLLEYSIWENLTFWLKDEGN